MHLEQSNQRVTKHPGERLQYLSSGRHSHSGAQNSSTDVRKIPTVILVLGSPNEDIIRISARYPILALFLSVTCINKRTQVNKMRSRSADTIIDLGPYGTIDQRASSSKDPHRLQTDEDVPYLSRRLSRWGILGAHVLAGGGAGVIIWITIDLAMHGVVTWACWTSFYPVIWLALAIVNYFAGVITIRHSLRLPTRVTTSLNDADETGSTELVPITSTEHPRAHVPSTGSMGRTESRLEGNQHPLPNSQTLSDDAQAGAVPPFQSAAKSALFVLDLKQEGGTVLCTRRRFADLSKACVDLLNNATYLYGTAIFSSLTMVSGHNAIEVLCVYAGVAVVSRVVAEWVLEEMGGAD